MKEDADIKAIEGYLNSRDFTITVGMTSKIQVNEYEPKTLHIEMSVEKTLEDDLSSLYTKVATWLNYKLGKWENAVRLQKEVSVSSSVQVPMKDVVEDAKNGGPCKKCGALMTVWKEGGVSKTTGKAYSGFWSCKDYSTHK